MTFDHLKFEKTRISVLLAALERMAGGDVHCQIPVSEAMDELDAIAHAVNVMAGEALFRVRELRDAQAHLVQSGKLAALGEVSSGLAHELNNPLAIIRAYVEKALDVLRKPTPEPGDHANLERALTRIDASVHRMSVIIRHIMDFSRQAPQQPHRRVLVETLIEKSLILMNEQLRLKNIKLLRDVEEPTLSALGNEIRLEQVLINLLTNARDAIIATARKEGGTVRIAARAVSPVELELVVVDDGIGMNEEIRNNIFTPFFTTKEVGMGTGLGLSISLGIVQEHGGTIVCKSVRGTGTEFVLRLPRWRNEAGDFVDATLA